MKKSNYLFALALGASTLTFAQVGIGTTTPSVPLDIEATDAALDINNTAADGDPKINFQLNNTTTFSIGIDDTDDKFKIGTTAPDASTAVTVQSTGEVGIGTSNPSYNLTVIGNIYGRAVTNAGTAFYLHNSSGSRPMWITSTTTAGTTSPWTFNTLNSWDFRTDGVSGLSIDPWNRVRVAHGNYTGGAFGRTFSVNGDAGGTTAWFNDSDERLKKNITTIPNSLNKVMALRGVNYEWKDTTHHLPGIQMGFIAQEAEQIIPEVVDAPQNDTSYYSMQYAPLTALLVEAIKEQQAIIEAQKREIETQKAENAAQEKEVEEVKADASNNAEEIEALKAQVQQLLQLIQQQESASVK
ncbi:MAG: hypothetical protein CMP61_10345 [Flavobacteriales bacterium]|nr:hypothetical protein [Flavobacteriales bacterium]|tara:strand:+ start:2960 stop:4024 length:1065 start_codon:yes stop_codon:yes gene_type:complete